VLVASPSPMTARSLLVHGRGRGKADVPWPACAGDLPRSPRCPGPLDREGRALLAWTNRAGRAPSWLTARRGFFIARKAHGGLLTARSAAGAAPAVASARSPGRAVDWPGSHGADTSSGATNRPTTNDSAMSSTGQTLPEAALFSVLWCQVQPDSAPCPGQHQIGIIQDERVVRRAQVPYPDRMSAKPSLPAGTGRTLWRCRGCEERLG
jgi:hypothetical protein